MPLLEGFYFSFPVACHRTYTSEILSRYPLRPDGFYTKNLDSLERLRKCTAVENLEPPYFESVVKSLEVIRNIDVYRNLLLNSSHLVFTYRNVPLLIFDNASNEFSSITIVIDLVYLIPHYITDEKRKLIELSKKRWKVIGLLTGFLGFAFLKSLS